jgi:hypothetical protein
MKSESNRADEATIGAHQDCLLSRPSSLGQIL